MRARLFRAVIDNASRIAILRRSFGRCDASVPMILAMIDHPVDAVVNLLHAMHSRCSRTQSWCWLMILSPRTLIAKPLFTSKLYA